MDNGTLYDRKLYPAVFEMAQKQGVKVQAKTAVSGANDAAAIHQVGDGVRVLAISTPCRYLHSSACLINLEDMQAQLDTARQMLALCASGEV